MRCFGIIGVGLLLLLSTVGWSAPMLDLDPSTVGTWRLPDGEAPARLTLAGSYALLSTGTNGVRIVDVSNPLAPQPAGRIPTSQAMHVRVVGNRLYVADGYAGLKIFDATDILSPQLISSLALSNCLNVEVALPHVYVSRGSLGVSIVDVSDLANPHPVGEFGARRFAGGVAVHGGYAYLATWDGLVTVDVSTPSAPRYASTNAGFFELALVHSNYLYAASGAVSVFDLTVPSKPVYVTQRFWGSDDAADIDVREAHLVVTDLDGTHVFDVREPTNPYRVAYVAGADPVVAVRWPHLYSANRDSWSGLPNHFVVDDLSRPANPQRATRTISSGLVPTSMDVAGDYAYLNNSGLEVYDVRDRLNPVRLHTQGFLGTHVAVSGQRLYAGWAYGSRQLSIYSLTNPVVPVRIGFTENWYFKDMVPWTNWLFISQNNVLVVLDATYAAGIHEVARVNGWPGDSAGRLKRSGSLLCFGWYEYLESSGFALIDIRDPTRPQWLGSFASPAGYGPGGIAFGSNYVCFSGRDRIDIVDITSPNNLRSMGSVEGVAANDLMIRDGYLYATGPWLTVIDVSDPTRPRIVGRNTGFESRELVDANSVLYGTGGYGTGLIILDPYQPLRLGLSSSAGGMELSVSGPPRQSFRIQTSGDAVRWEDWTTASSPSRLPILPGADPRFYRAAWP